MARTKRHFIPGCIWHITHRYHKKEFLFKKEKGSSLRLTLTEKFNNQHAPDFTGDVDCYVFKNIMIAHNILNRALLNSVRIFLSLSLLYIVSCTSASVVQESPQIIREAVMTEGVSIIVQTQYGEFIIKAGKGAERSYTWDGKTLNTVLVPRKKRWNGTLGLLDDNKLNPPHKDVIHMVIEECQIHYSSFANAAKGLSKHSKFEPNIENIYRDDGLFVRFIKREMEIEGKYFVDISVFQILINGEKPSQLPESQNHKITVLKL